MFLFSCFFHCNSVAVLCTTSLWVFSVYYYVSTFTLS